MQAELAHGLIGRKNSCMPKIIIEQVEECWLKELFERASAVLSTDTILCILKVLREMQSSEILYQSFSTWSVVDLKRIPMETQQLICTQ